MSKANVHKMISKVMEGKDPRTVVEAVDEQMVNELYAFIENDGNLYRSQLVPMIKNIVNKMANGTYNHNQAPKLWKYLADNGAKKYTHEWPGTVFDVPTRMEVAQRLADFYFVEANFGNYDSYLNKKNQQAVGSLEGWAEKNGVKLPD